jgi:DNA-directed RNA polymerase subunit RPC12/RpoP
MRALLLEVPGLRLRVRYAERPTRRPLARCPVCGGSLRPIRNQTLLGDEVTLGYRCGRCSYWTHLKRRVPVRYQFVPAALAEGPADELGVRVSRLPSG